MTLIFVWIGVPASAQWVILDDFESYADTPDLLAVWSNYELDTAVAQSGSQSMVMDGSWSFNTGTSSRIEFAPTVHLAAFEISVKLDASTTVDRVTFRYSVLDPDGDACGGAQNLTTNEWVTLSVALPDDCINVNFEPDRIDELQLSFSNSSTTMSDGDIVMNHDDLRVLPAVVFTDGFEDGNTGAWN